MKPELKPGDPHPLKEYATCSLIGIVEGFYVFDVGAGWWDTQRWNYLLARDPTDQAAHGFWSGELHLNAQPDLHPLRRQHLPKTFCGASEYEKLCEFLVAHYKLSL